MTLTSFLANVADLLSRDVSAEDTPDFQTQLSAAKGDTDTPTTPPLTAHFITFLHTRFEHQTGDISRQQLKTAVEDYIERYHADPNLSTQVRDKITYLKNTSIKQLDSILSGFDESDKTLSGRDFLLASLYANNSDENLEAEGVSMMAFADIKPYVLRSPNALGPAPTPIEHPKESEHETEEPAIAEDNARPQAQQTTNIDDPRLEDKVYVNAPEKFHIVPGANPDKVTIYYYDTKNERYYNAFYQSGDEIGSTKIFIKSDYCLDTIEQALGYYAQSEFGDCQHKFENIVFSAHGLPDGVGPSATHNRHKIDLFDLWTTLDKVTDNIDMFSCSILGGYVNVSDAGNIEFLQKKIDFADDHDLNIMANSIISYQNWSTNEDDDGPGGRAYLLNADGLVLRVRRPGDDDLSGYVDDAEVRAFVGHHIRDIWTDRGGLYATDHEAVEQQLKIVQWSQKSIDQM